MPDVLIRGIDAKAMGRLKSRAKRHGRSLQREAKLVLEQAAGVGPEEIITMMGGWKERFAGRRFSGSATIIREGRKR